jgi:hypothetical protein
MDTAGKGNPLEQANTPKIIKNHHPGGLLRFLSLEDFP